MSEQVILVNEADEMLGLMPKMEAHEKGLLHRAFSVFVFNQKGELMLQQRALHKYHSGGLWTNTCCSHPKPYESTTEAAHRRLVEEMGFDCPIEPCFEFTYKAALDNELTEHEYDHVFVGQYDDQPNINTDEVHSWAWKSIEQIDQELLENPQSYTEWFKIAWPKLKSCLPKI